jgi:DNA processing protein
VWEAGPDHLLRVFGVDRRVQEALCQYRGKINVDNEWEWFLQSGVGVITIDAPCYPRLLKNVINPPPLLFYRGTLAGIEQNTIAIVGSRRCTAYGRHVAELLGRDLAEAGFTVVSGMARGIDGAAHRGALQKGCTIAVLGSGVDIIYPPEHKKLYEEILEVGAVLSEYHPGTSPKAPFFPARNRIISGLSSAVIVVEAAEKSGALITVDFALEQGRDVYAVPGSIMNPCSKGVHKLIQQGAKLVSCIEDILEDYGLTSRSQHTMDTVMVEMTLEEQTLLNHIGMTPVSVDWLVQQSGWEVSRISSIIIDLEIKGLVESVPGKRFKLTEVKGLRR